MATFEELKAQMEQNNAAIEAAAILAADANVKLDAVNVKIDELRANGNPVSQAQLDVLAALGSIASVGLTAVSENLAGIAADVADAEQS